MKVYCLLVILICSVACQLEQKTDRSEGKENGLKKGYLERKEMKDSVCLSQTLSWDDYAMTVKTVHLFDSAVDKEPIFIPAIWSQKIEFRKGGKLLQTHWSPALSTERKLSRTKKVILENVIDEVGVLAGRHGCMFFLDGVSPCNSCTEMKLVFSLEGKLLFAAYGSRYEKHFRYGNWEQIIEEYGIGEENFIERMELEGVLEGPRY
ncbi:hypothetical protein [Saprospira grandis]|uniref:hypothetical protein n=1 Tax=Saprospira grandis TaxID=1008 RepID=UPI0022DD0B95|nr:hypothetical protein [Saprospira grandis]WBM74616.1 hypothetical protein OP864_16660 [Saprospira grandis]